MKKENEEQEWSYLGFDNKIFLSTILNLTTKMSMGHWDTALCTEDSLDSVPVLELGNVSNDFHQQDEKCEARRE
jgi:hypothetical protein